MKLQSILLVLSLSTVLFGCNAQHDYMYYTANKAKVENQLNEPLELTVCSTATKTWSAGRQDHYHVRSLIKVSADPNSEIKLPSNSRHEIKYDYNGGFDYVQLDDVNYIHFELEDSSFDLAKLCLNEETQTNILIGKNENCPAGSFEQTEPGTCN